jgi:phytoene synthase
MSAAVGNAPVQFAPTASQVDVAYSVCRHIARSAAKNFYYGFMVLPRRKRNALSAVYAYMRRCDDISDDASLSLQDRRIKLADWLDSVHRAFAGEPTDEPVLLALTDAQRRYHIPVGLLDQLAYGTAEDVLDDLQDQPPQTGVPTTRYRTFDDLQHYCYGVASVVGLVCIRIFGYRDPAAEPLAERCGVAFQLTNIIRDVKEDAGLGRIYFPEEDMAEFGLTASDVASMNVAKLRPLLAKEADRAREFYRSGEELIPLVNEDSQPALWVLVNIYRRLLEKIAARQYDVFSDRVRLSTTEKLTVLGKGYLKRLA